MLPGVPGSSTVLVLRSGTPLPPPPPFGQNTSLFHSEQVKSVPFAQMPAAEMGVEAGISLFALKACGHHWVIGEEGSFLLAPCQVGAMGQMKS